MNFTVSRSRARLAALLSTASLGAMFASNPVLAQGAMMVPQDEIPETVLITGSLIAGTVPIGVPVSNLTPRDFAETGQLSLTDILKSVPALDIDAQASPTYGGGTLSFEQNVQIHSLGTGSGVETLLMVNGLRFPPQNYSNDTVNPNIIPQIALERVDVLTAGSSAVYGSDATAGVINLILKRGFDGAMTQIQTTTAPSIGYLSGSIAQLYGKSWESGNFTGSLTITDSKALHAEERSYYTVDFRPWGLMDFTPIGSSIPAIAHAGNSSTRTFTNPNPPPATIPSPAGETSANGTLFCGNCFSVPKHQDGTGLTWAAIQANPGVLNERNPWWNSDVRPHLQSVSLTGVFDQRLTENLFGFLGPVSLFADGFYYNYRGKQVYAPGNGQARAVLQRNLPVPSINPYFPTGAPTNLRVDYSFALEIPTFITGGETAAHFDFGFNLDKLPFDWHGKLTYSMTDDKNFGDASNSINPSNLQAALGNTISVSAVPGIGQGAYTYTKPAAIPYLNVFCDPNDFVCNDPATLKYVTGYRNQHEHFKIQETAVNFSGPVFMLPGGPIEAAIAGQTLSYHWTYQNLQNDNTASTAVVTNGIDAAGQTSYALFGQVNIPVFGGDFTLPGFEAFTIELGYRYDHYSNLDDPVWTPKVAANWLVGGGLTLRGAWGKSFRVPSFAENSPLGSRVAGLNDLGGKTNATDLAQLDCTAVSGHPPTPGVPIPGSLTALLNPTCNTTTEALVRPGGISIELSGNGAAAILRGHGLSPQTLKQWSLGFNWTPPENFLRGWLNGLNFDVTWFRLEFNGLISGNNAGQGPNDPLSFERYTVIPRPDLPITAPENASFYQLVQDLINVPQRGGFTFDPAFLPNIKFIQDSALTNVGSRVFSGIDFDVRYDFDLAKLGFDDAGAINIGATGYYQTIDKSRSREGAGLDDTYEGKESGNRLQRVRYRLGWSNETWSVTGFANYFGHAAINLNGSGLVPPCFYQTGIPPGTCYPPALGQPTSAYFGPANTYPNITPATVFFDLTLGYTTGERPANRWLRNIGVQLTINDIFDKKPPFIVGARGNGSIRAFDNAFVDLQRTFTLQLTKTW